MRDRAKAVTATVNGTAMSRVLAVAGAVAVLLFGASASFGSDLRMTVERPHFTCEGHSHHFSDVAYRPGAADGAPLPCCDGQIGCAQFLSTNTVVRVPHEWHG